MGTVQRAELTVEGTKMVIRGREDGESFGRQRTKGTKFQKNKFKRSVV